MPRKPVYQVGHVPTEDEVKQAWRRMFPDTPITRPLREHLQLMVNHNPRRLSHEINRVRGWAFDLEDLQ